MTTVVVGNNTGDDFPGVDDTYISLATPTGSFSSGNAIAVYIYNASYINFGALRFTGLSSISGPVTVSSATLSVYAEYSSETHYSWALRRLLQSSADYTRMTWNNYASGVPWDTAGCQSDGVDRVSAVSASVAGNTTLEYKDFAGSLLNTDVEDIINGYASNLGWLVSFTDESPASYNSEFANFTSSEGSDGHRPKLLVSYSTGGGGVATILPQLMTSNLGADLMNGVVR